MTNNGAEAVHRAVLLVAAAALVDADRRILVQRRPADAAHGGLWEFPGGKLEAGEGAAAALVRELDEELAIGVDPVDCVPLAFATGDTGDRPLILLLFVCRRWRGAPTPLPGAALRWVEPLALHGLAMPPADRPLIGPIVAALEMEARPGIEPGCKDLQSSASPLRHRAPMR